MHMFLILSYIQAGVHIADVTHFIKPGTNIDEEAINRGTTVYLVDQVIIYYIKVVFTWKRVSSVNRVDPFNRVEHELCLHGRGPAQGQLG